MSLLFHKKVDLTRTFLRNIHFLGSSLGDWDNVKIEHIEHLKGEDVKVNKEEWFLWQWSYIFVETNS